MCDSRVRQPLTGQAGTTCWVQGAGHGMAHCGGAHTAVQCMVVPAGHGSSDLATL